MFRRIDDFASVYETERDGTIKVMDQLTDASLAQAVEPGGRTIGRIAWHLTQSLPDLLTRTGIILKGPGENEAVPASARKIRDVYAATSGQIVDAVRAKNTDAQLEDVLDMYGEHWTRGHALFVMVMHEVHHRGQLTVLMRQAGLKVPGVAGPAREDWAQWGMPLPVI